jgi:hypothetical protein
VRNILFILSISFLIPFGAISQYADNFSSDELKLLVPYRKKELWGFSTFRGEIVIEPQYKAAGMWDRDFAVVEKKDGSFVKINVHNEEIEKSDKEELNYYQNRGFEIERTRLDETIDYDEIEKENEKKVKKQNNLFGLKINNKLIIPFRYKVLKFFNDSIAIAKNSNNLWGIICKSKVLAPFRYQEITMDNIRYYAADLIFKSGNKYGAYTDVDLRDTARLRVKKIETIYDDVDFLQIAEYGRVILISKNKLWGVKWGSNTAIKYDEDSIVYMGQALFRATIKGKVVFFTSEKELYEL